MGLRKDLDTKMCKRYVYYITHNNVVVYVGASENPKGRFKQHLNKAKKGNNALIYKYIRKVNYDVSMKIIESIYGNYATVEKVEISHIEKNCETTLNFYNNPNKDNYYKAMENLSHETKND